MDLETFDPQNPQWQIQRYVPLGNETYWKLVDWEHIEGAVTTWIRVQTFANGQPATGVKVQHFFPQPPPPYHGVEEQIVEMKHTGTEWQPVAEFDVNPANSQYDAQGHGPHNIRLLERSDVIYGSGTPVKNYHYQDRFVFELVQGAPQPPPNDDYVTWKDFEETLEVTAANLEALAATLRAMKR